MAEKSRGKMQRAIFFAEALDLEMNYIQIGFSCTVFSLQNDIVFFLFDTIYILYRYVLLYQSSLCGNKQSMNRVSTCSSSVFKASH